MTTAPPPAVPPPSPPPLDPPSWEPPPPPPGPPARPQLRRSRSDKILGGVAGGLADYSGIDALLWRVGFVALALAGGTGVVVYLLLWLLMPAGPPAYGAPVHGPGQQPVPAPARPRSPVPGVTVAALLIVVGVLALITRFSGWDAGPRLFLGSALLVVGLGLIAAAFSSGRTARGGLIALGVVLSLALLVASTQPWKNVRGGVGDRTFRPVSESQVREVYRGGLGDMTVDLTGVDVSNLAAPITTRVEHGVGDLEIRVPRDADVRLDVMSGVGSIDTFGQGSVDNGFFPGTGSGSWIDDGRAEFVITVHNGAGDVEVSRG